MNLHAQLGIDLVALDRKLREVIEKDADLPRPSVIYDGIDKLITAGGKRLRPMMVLIGGRFGERLRYDAVMRTAVLLEYLHMASLIHDDIIDRSDLRRGEPTLHKLTDVQSAIHIANYMMSRVVEWSMTIEGEDQEAEAYRIAVIAGVVTELCLGEFLQMDNRFNFNLTMDSYLDKTKRKTALLMAECLRAGARAAHADKEMSELLYKYGEALGMAFQIQDDILDFTQPKEAIGKPAGADLRNGNITLPVLLAMEDPAFAVRIRSLSSQTPELEFDEMITIITKSPAIERSLEYSKHYAEKARAIILPLSQHPAYSDLQVLADYFVGE